MAYPRYVLLTAKHVFRDSRGRPVTRTCDDEPFVIENLYVAQRLEEQGIVAPAGELGQREGTASQPLQPTLRIGVWANTSDYYSGGRIHIYQYAWAMAQLGAEVFFMTDRLPKWRLDYPEPTAPIKFILNDSGEQAPRDLDLCFTDGKSQFGAKASAYARRKDIPLVVLNFETPNWVAKFLPKIAERMAHAGGSIVHADVLLANSEESLKHALEYPGYVAGSARNQPARELLTGVLNPMVNTFAIEANATNPYLQKGGDVPYVVWSARSSEYKGLLTACQAILALDRPMNLALIGMPAQMPKDTELHKFISFKGITDAEKFALMKDAEFVIAPSKFEGYGMVPGEALCCGKNTVVYDLPVLREAYGDKLVMAKWGDAEDFGKKVKQLLGRKSRPNRRTAMRKYSVENMPRVVRKLPYHAPPTEARVSAQIICHYGPTITECLESLYPHVHEILIAHGPTKLWSDWPSDDSLEAVKSFPDPEGKIRLHAQKEWFDKLEMRSWCARNATGNRMLVADADEIYVGLDRLISSGELWGCPRWVHFWHGLDHFVHDPAGDQRWGRRHELGGSVHPHYRWSFWRPSYRFTRHCTARDSVGTSLCNGRMTEELVARVPDCAIYHLGHCLNRDLMRRKHEFYESRDGGNPERIRRHKAWHDWDGKLGDCGDGTISKFEGPLPELVKQAMKKAQA